MVLNAFMFIDVLIGSAIQVAASLRALPEVKYAERVTGPYDIILTIEVADVQALDDFTHDRVHSLPGVTKTTTCLVTS